MARLPPAVAGAGTCSGAYGVTASLLLLFFYLLTAVGSASCHIHEFSAHFDPSILYNGCYNSLLFALYSGCGQLYEKAVCRQDWSSPQLTELVVDVLLGTRSHWPTRALTIPDVSWHPSPIS